MAALAAGLSLFACTTGGETQETAEFGGSEFGGADYGGAPPPCDDLDAAKPLVLGSNPVDTTTNTDDFTSSCAQLQGAGPDELYEFIPQTAGNYSFSLVDPSFEGWLLNFGSYDCSPYFSNHCDPAAPSLDIELGEGSVLYLTLDGTAGGTGTIEVTKN